MDRIHKEKYYNRFLIKSELKNIIEKFITIILVKPDLNGFCELTGITTKPIAEIPIGSSVIVDISDYLEMIIIHYNGKRYMLEFKLSVSVYIADIN